MQALVGSSAARPRQQEAVMQTLLHDPDRRTEMLLRGSLLPRKAGRLRLCSRDRAELGPGCKRASRYHRLEVMPRQHGKLSSQAPCVLRALSQHPELLRMSED